MLAGWQQQPVHSLDAEMSYGHLSVFAVKKVNSVACSMVCIAC